MTRVPLSQPATLALSTSAAKPPWLLSGCMLRTSVQTAPAICSLSGSVVLSPALLSSAASSLLLSLVCFFSSLANLSSFSSGSLFFVGSDVRRNLWFLRIVLASPQRDSCQCVPSSAMATFFQFTPSTSTKSASHLLICTFIPCLYFSQAFVCLRSFRPLLVPVEQQSFEREALLRGPLQVRGYSRPPVQT